MIVGTAELSGLAGRVVMVDGGFDPLHAGHIAYFRAAAELGLPVLCNMRSDDYLPAAKRRPALLPQTQRAALLDALEMISYVHICNTRTVDVLRQLSPAAYAKGSDWEGRLPAEEVSVCAERGIDLRFLEITVPTSSTQLVRAFLDNAPTGPVRRSVPRELAPSLGSPYALVLTSHENRYLSGVAKFNALLGQRMNAPVRAADALPTALNGPVLVSMKLADCTAAERARLVHACDALRRLHVPYDLFFHSFQGLREEQRLLHDCRNAYTGNAELSDAVRAAGGAARTLWCPALLDPAESLSHHGLTIFSFGMAHKLQVTYYERLKAMLDDLGLEHQLLVSTAFHEKASFGYIDELEGRFRTTFGDRVHLLGFLSDASVNHFLARADLFCAFFGNGVRTNNTSALAAMEAGVPLLTNLDAYSPGWLRHGANVLDVHRLRPDDLDPHALERVGRAGQEAVTEHASWDDLIARLAETAYADEATHAQTRAGVSFGSATGFAVANTAVQD